MKSMFLLFVALLVPAQSVSNAESPFEGAWHANVPSPNGRADMDATFTFHVEGSKLTGTVAAATGTFDLVDCHIDKNQIAFSVDGDTGKMSGTLAGDEIRMQIKYSSGENGTRVWPFAAKRVKAPALAANDAVDGIWVGEVPRGESRFIAARFELHVADHVVTGRVFAVDDEFPIVDGEMKDGELSFNVGSTKGDFSGRLVGGDLQMKVRYNGGESGRQTLAFVLKRAKN